MQNTGDYPLSDGITAIIFTFNSAIILGAGNFVICVPALSPGETITLKGHVSVNQDWMNYMAEMGNDFWFCAGNCASCPKCSPSD